MIFFFCFLQDKFHCNKIPQCFLKISLPCLHFWMILLLGIKWQTDSAFLSELWVVSVSLFVTWFLIRNLLLLLSLYMFLSSGWLPLECLFPLSLIFSYFIITWLVVFVLCFLCFGLLSFLYLCICSFKRFINVTALTHSLGFPPFYYLTWHHVCCLHFFHSPVILSSF